RGGIEDPSSDADLGDQFLLRRGFTLVWVGWQFDVPAGPLVGIQAPRASGVTGTAKATVVLTACATETTIADLIAYPPADAAAGDGTLTVRDGPFGMPETIARNRW